MLGAIIGDIVGSVYEFNNYRTTEFEPFFHPNASFTDDTVCTIAIASALLDGESPAQSLKAWGRRYWSIGGWGGKFAEWLLSDSLAPYGSFGNGAAMRISPVALLAESYQHALELARHVTVVTHDHPEGVRGALATALAIFHARHGAGSIEIQAEIEHRFGYDLTRTVDEIRENYVFNETCQETVPQALCCALSANSYESAIRNAISIGGDSDTVAAIAGGLAEALFGLPQSIAQQGMDYLPREMQAVVDKLYRHSGEVMPWLAHKR